MIRGHGSARPKAFFVSDAPHGEDIVKDYALVGYAGNTLDGFCKEQKLSLDGQFWRTCLVKEPLPKDDNEELTKTKALIEQYKPILIDEINELQPNLIIPIGELAFSFFTGFPPSSIYKFRGSVLPASGDFQTNKPIKILPILGPNPYLNRDYKLRILTRVDFGKIVPNWEETPLPDNLYNIWVARSSTALRSFFDRHYQPTIEKGGFLNFDIETYFQIPICISFCFDGFESVCVPLVDQSIDFDNRVLMMNLVARMLKSPICKVNQNIKYDWKIMERWGFVVNNISGDTMLATSVLYCEFPKNLGFLTSIYTDIPYFKDEGKQFDPERTKRDRYYLYNAKDSLASHQIYTRQTEEIKEQKVDFVYNNLVKLIPLYMRMENRGIRIDEEEQLKLLAKYESLFHIQELSLKRLLGRNFFNPLSNQQCREAIYDELQYKKIRGIKTTKAGEPSTDEEALELLLVYGEAKNDPGEVGRFVLECILNARKIHKVIEILELHLHPDKRFRCEFNLAGTETGRSSAGETTDQLLYLSDTERIKITNLGHSLQTIGKHGFMMNGVTYGRDLRRMFVPSFGYSFVEIDLSGAEARVDRVLSGNFDMGVFDSPGIHRLTGSWVYDCQPSEIKKNILVNGVDRYHMAKTVRHAGERNMGPDRMVMMTQRPLRECTAILEKFHRFQSEIREVFHHDIRKAIDAPEHCLVAPNGRRRDFFGRIDKGTYNEGISYLPQAIVSDQTKFSLIPTFDECKWAFLLSEQHDGTLAEVPIGREWEYARVYKKNIETSIDFRTCTLRRDYELVIPAEVSFGANWYEMEETKE